MTRGPVALGNPTIKTNAAMHLFYVHEGVVRWSSAFEMAAAVEVGTATFWDPQATQRIARELGEFLAEEGVKNVREIVGTLIY